MKTYLVTGGTGSFGKQVVCHLSLLQSTRKVIVLSRCEHKQLLMQQHPDIVQDKVRYHLGCIRDRERCMEAFKGVDVVIHAAALKQVPAGQRNPGEFVATNIDGTINVIKAACACNVDKVMILSSDKAVEPHNNYGCCKAVVEHSAIASNVHGPTQIACTRWGNVWGSHGSVMEKWANARDGDPVHVTDFDMTRFVLSLPEASKFLLHCLGIMKGGEIFVPKLRATTLRDIFRCYFDAKREHQVVGRRAGEKLHETLIAAHEVPRVSTADDTYIIHPPPDAGLPTYCREPYGVSHCKGNPDGPISSDRCEDMVGWEELREKYAG